MKDFITGIQQVGIGVNNADHAKIIYKDNFCMNVKVFDDVADAVLMTRYTGDIQHRRRAILSLNMAGGGGFEIWQFISRQASAPDKEIALGDTGIFATKLKSGNIEQSYNYYKNNCGNVLTPIFHSPDKRRHFWLRDTYGNWFNIVESNEWFKKNNTHCGGVCGVVIGVSDMQAALKFYKTILGSVTEVYQTAGRITDMPVHGENLNTSFHRVLLHKKVSNTGAFSKLLGDIEIELVQNTEISSNHIYNNRFWGDCGFIHLCFDVTDMDNLKLTCSNAGYPFTVDSNDSFTMDSAAGRFCYVEDPDGTLIELVETHKVPILKKWGLYLDLKKRTTNKPLPGWMINFMALSKIK